MTANLGPVRRGLRGLASRTRPVRRQAERIAVRTVRGAITTAVDRLEDPALTRVGGTRLVVRGLLVALARALARRHPDLDTDILFEITLAHAAALGSGDDPRDPSSGDDVAQYWTMRARSGRTSVRPVRYPEPDVTMRLDLVDFLELAAGRQTGLGLMSAGRLEVEGNTMHAMALARAIAAMR